MIEILLLIMACLLPTFTIVAFIIGYNVNADRKLFRKKSKKSEDTEKDKILDRIDNATVY